MRGAAFRAEYVAGALGHGMNQLSHLGMLRLDVDEHSVVLERLPADGPDGPYDRGGQSGA